MKSKIFVLVAVFAFTLNVASITFAQIKMTTQRTGIAGVLPQSDGVLTLDVYRLLNEAAPQYLSGKPQMLADINAKIDELRAKTGLDVRQFEQLVVGISTKQISAREVDLEPVFLARGKYNANALIALAKVASNGKYREEKFGNRTVYIFTGKEIVEQNKPKTNNSWFDQALDRLIKGLSKEIAVTSLDGNTLAFGSLARVRETLEGKAKVNNEVLSLVNRKPNALVSFGMQLPNGLSSFVQLDNDELGKTLDSIRQLSGAVEIANNNASVSMVAKTLRAEQAQTLHETLEGLQMIGKTFVGAGRGEDKKVMARLIDNARITRNSSEVMLDLQVPQSDINILLGVK